MFFSPAGLSTVLVSIVPSFRVKARREGFWTVLSFPLCSIHPRRWYLFHRLIPSNAGRNAPQGVVALETSLDVSIAAAWVDSADHLGRSQWQVGHRTPPPIPPTKTSGKQQEPEQDLLEKDKHVNDNPKIVRFHVTFQMRHVCWIHN